MQSVSRLLAIAASGTAMLLLVCGCSAESSAASSLATTASDASAAAQTASYDLQLDLSGQVTPGVSTTALGDAMRELQKEDSTLTGSQQPTAIQKLATRTLTLVRQAEDATLQAQAVLGTPSESSQLTTLKKRLHRISASLTKIENTAQAQS